MSHATDHRSSRSKVLLDRYSPLAKTLLVGGLIAALIVPFALKPLEWSAWLLMYASFAVVLAPKSIRKDGALLLATIVVVAAHHLISIVNAWWMVLPGADIDAVTFHESAAAFARNHRFYFEVGYEFYENLLALAYAIAGSSLLVGQGFSILAFGVSCAVFASFLECLRIRDNRWLVMLAYGLLPSGLLLTSFTLRESWELLFFMLTVLFAVRFRATRRRGSLALMLASAIGLGLFHKALVLYSISFVLLVMAIVAFERVAVLSREQRVGLVVIVLATCMVVGYLAFELTGVGSDLIRPLGREGVLDYIYKYRMQIDFLGRPRTAFNLEYDLRTPLSGLISLGELYFFYLFAPLTGGMHDPMDFYAFCEAAIRLILLVSVVATWRFAARNDGGAYSLLLLSYVSMTFMWSLGTTNVGQAMRHHVLTNWIIIVAGMPALVHLLRSRNPQVSSSR